VVKFTYRPFQCWRSGLWHPLNWRVDRPLGRSGRFGRQETALRQPEFETRVVCLPAISFFTVLTENMRILVRNGGEVTGNDREEIGSGRGK
jgi:hypothetical protein